MLTLINCGCECQHVNELIGAEDFHLDTDNETEDAAGAAGDSLPARKVRSGRQKDQH